MNHLDRINQRLKALLAYTKKLEAYRDISVKQLRDNQDTALVVERLLHLASECIIDIANLINAEYRHQTPQDAHDSIVILGEEEVLPKNFAHKLAPIAGFRNILVHDYLKIDYEKLADKLHNNLDDFKTFARHVAQFLQ